MHRSTEIKKSFVIISAERFTNTIEENKKNHLELMTQLKKDKFSIKEVEGVYHGTSEKSILVILNNKWLFTDLGYLKNYASIFDQESILFVDGDRNATLIFMKKPWLEEKLGKFISVSKGIATQMSNYTFDGRDHYICDLRKEFYGS
jgi:hypothetical protein